MKFRRKRVPEPVTLIGEGSYFQLLFSSPGLYNVRTWAMSGAISGVQRLLFRRHDLLRVARRVREEFKKERKTIWAF